MVNRFSNMLNTIKACYKKGDQSCIIISNKLCIDVLRLFRDYHYIFGFTYMNITKGHSYPKVKVFLKYSDSNIGVIKDLKIFKNTKSNFTIKKATILPFSYNQRLLITNAKGLFLTNDIHYFAKKDKMKVLATITV